MPKLFHGGNSGVVMYPSRGTNPCCLSQSATLYRAFNRALLASGPEETTLKENYAQPAGG
jgi:hypothetical protein